MKASALKTYRCVCIECDPLPPIDGLGCEPVEEPKPAAGTVLKGLAQRLLSARNRTGQ